MDKRISAKRIEEIKKMCVSLELISVYDIDSYSMLELYYMLAKKINETIIEMNRFEISINEEVEKQTSILDSLLNNGLHNEVISKIDEMIVDGTFDTIINNNVFKLINNKIDDFKTEYEEFKVSTTEKIDSITFVIKPTTDYNTKINEILSSNPNATIMFDNGVHEIENIVIEDKENFTICGNKNAILKLKDNSNNTLLWIKDSCSNVLIKNLNVDGNKDNQTHLSKHSTPFANNSALLLIQSNNTTVKNINIKNTRLYALRCCAYTDGYEYLDNIRVENINVENCLGGVECVFCEAPIMSNIKVKNIGGKFVRINSVSSNAVITDDNVTHDFNNFIPIYDSNKKVKCRLEKSNSIANTRTIYYTSKEGGNPIVGDYVFTGDYKSNGIVMNNCNHGYIKDSVSENTTLMGIGIINNTKGGKIINCHAYGCGEEGLCLDGAKNGVIENSFTECCSINSNAPSIHVANISPGIDDCRNNKVENNIVIDSYFTGISTGLKADGKILDSTIVKNNLLYRTKDINDAKGILVLDTVVEGNTINNYQNGIVLTQGDRKNPIKNNNVNGVSQSVGVGISILNSAHIVVRDNSVHNFNIALSNGVQGANKFLNNYINCTTSLDVCNKPTGTEFVNNISNNVFVNGLPSVIDSKDKIKNTADVSQSRKSYESPIQIDYKNGYLLKVKGDGGYNYPSVKHYLCYLDNLILISDSTQSSDVINVVVNKTSNKIELSVTGSGGSKGISYDYIAIQ
jgi:hypothetical protein|nr:MAG TPA: Poly(beta-D-mannuronate) C5 epimerase [Caudoviricetes sp.]